jgi:hypothetical protein
MLETKIIAGIATGSSLLAIFSCLYTIPTLYYAIQELNDEVQDGVQVLEYTECPKKWQFCDFWATFSSFLIFTQIILSGVFYERNRLRAFPDLKNASHHISSLDQGQECVSKIREFAQSIYNIEKPPIGHF